MSVLWLQGEPEATPQGSSDHETQAITIQHLTQLFVNMLCGKSVIVRLNIIVVENNMYFL